MNMKQDKDFAAKVWWENQQTTKQYLSDIKNAVVDYKKMVVSQIAWSDYFRKIITGMARDQGFSVYPFNCRDYSSEDSSCLLDWIVDTVGLQADYYGTVESIRNELGKGKGLWIFWNLSEEQCDELDELSVQLDKAGVQISFIVLSIPLRLTSLVSMEHQYSDVDLYFFTWDILMQKNSTDLIEYKAILINQFAHGKPERIAECCNEADQCVCSPAEVCTWLSAEQLSRDRYRAQLRYLMPLLEMARYEMCRNFKGRLHDVRFPYPERFNNNPKSVNVYDNADQFEFRHWYYFNDCGNIRYLTPEEKECLKTLYKARNDLAHIHIIEEYERFIKIVSYCLEFWKRYSVSQNA